MFIIASNSKFKIIGYVVLNCDRGWRLEVRALKPRLNFEENSLKFNIQHPISNI